MHEKPSESGEFTIAGQYPYDEARFYLQAAKFLRIKIAEILYPGTEIEGLIKIQPDFYGIVVNVDDEKTANSFWKLTDHLMADAVKK